MLSNALVNVSNGRLELELWSFFKVKVKEDCNLDRGGSPPRPTAATKHFIFVFRIGIRIPPKRIEKTYRIK